MTVGGRVAVQLTAVALLWTSFLVRGLYLDTREATHPVHTLFVETTESLNVWAVNFNAVVGGVDDFTVVYPQTGAVCGYLEEVSAFGQENGRRTCCMNSNVMGVLGPDPPAPGKWGNLGPWADNRRRGSAGRILGARRAGMRIHNGMLRYVCAICLVCYRPSKRGTEDGVRDDGGWAGDTWYRRGAPSKAGGLRSVQLWSVAAGGAADSRSAGPVGSRSAAGRRSAQKANSLVRALGAGAR
ncbi:hypothetical protein EVAR_40986_1 [Eumeta japonica]|uniref:Uncharacterized protein n=1 Tax=Eumeta variegata TaxID=151549 RepID=A0A4C1XEX0_EUMVA|nr:hypothetical protein EVAR_40986_1 [Eumeta japonica]